MENNNIIKNKSRIGYLTPTSPSHMPHTRGTGRALDIIRGINQVNGWEKAAQAFELECDNNQNKYQTAKASMHNFEQTPGLPEVLTATNRAPEVQECGVSSLSPST